MTKSKTKYYPRIGIECHVQLNTVTKLFAAVGNNARDAAPNTLISHICMGMPGALPVLNENALKLAMRAAFAFKTKPQKYSYFERKHYFYPDLPKGYQITQLAKPIIVGGRVDLTMGGKIKQVNLNRVQIEEDAGKNIHPAGADYSLVDLNRAGTPLLEIVSEPDMTTSEEARAYVRELYLLVKYAGISDADLYHGNMRFDVNVSISADPKVLGTRTETKNLNSFKSVEKAVDYEIKRQAEILDKGGEIIQETRGWDDAKQKTVSQRGKEHAHDYRYMPDPDIPPIVLSVKDILAAESEMPTLPEEWRDRLSTLGLSREYTDLLLMAEVDDAQYSYLGLVEDNIKDKKKALALANWLVNVFMPLRAENKVSAELKDLTLSEILTGVYNLSSDGKLSSSAAKQLITTLITDGLLPDDLPKFAEESGLIQVSDEGAILQAVQEVIKENPQAAEDVKKGEMKAIGFLVGQIMKKTAGKANPALAQQLIKQSLGIK